MEGKTPVSQGSKTEPNLERLYASKELFTFEVSGIVFKVKDLTASELFDITKKAMVNNEVVQSIYARELMRSCIVEPKLDFARDMRGIAATEILGELERVLGLTELAQKKLNMR